MKKHLRDLLFDLRANHRFEISNSYDITGQIAIIRLSRTTGKRSLSIAKVIMKTHSNIKSVFAQLDAVHGDFRLRELRHILGENNTFTIHKESGCTFQVDVKKCYFSPRLSNERMRVCRLVQNKDLVLNMFAGVGCFSIIVAKYSDPCKVYSVDINPEAIRYMKENARINGAYGKVIPILGNAKNVIDERLQGSVDRVIMPLPEKALEYLPSAISALKNSGGWIHYQEFVHSRNEDPLEKAKLNVCERLKSVCTNFVIPSGLVVRPTGPNWCQVAIDIRIGSQGRK